MSHYSILGLFAPGFSSSYRSVLPATSADDILAILDWWGSAPNSPNTSQLLCSAHSLTQD